MKIFSQKTLAASISQSQLAKNAGFKFKESQTFNLGLGVFFFVLTGLSLLINSHRFTHARNAYFRPVIFVLAPAIFFTLKGIFHRKVLSVNVNGIYRYGNLITDWGNFSSAYITENKATASIKDDLILHIEYFEPDEDDYNLYCIPLTGMQTKAGEEILDTINFFTELYKEKNIASQSYNPNLRLT